MIFLTLSSTATLHMLLSTTCSAAMVAHLGDLLVPGLSKAATQNASCLASHAQIKH